MHKGAQPLVVILLCTKHCTTLREGCQECRQLFKTPKNLKMHVLNFSTSNSTDLACIEASRTGLATAVALELKM